MALNITERQINDVIINTCCGCRDAGMRYLCLNRVVGEVVQNQRAIKAVREREVEFDCEERTVSD
jgi:hypothetical protein